MLVRSKYYAISSFKSCSLFHSFIFRKQVSFEIGFLNVSTHLEANLPRIYKTTLFEECSEYITPFPLFFKFESWHLFEHFFLFKCRMQVLVNTVCRHVLQYIPRKAASLSIVEIILNIFRAGKFYVLFYLLAFFCTSYFINLYLIQ